jgi:hypothetical protein
LVGSTVHVRFALTNNHIYEAFGKTALIPGFQELWSSVVMPNIAFFALLLAAFEMTTGIRILSRGKYVRIGLAASGLFNLFLVQLGHASPEAGWKADVLVNRLPNLLFALPQLALFGVHFDKSLPELLCGRLRSLAITSQQTHFWLALCRWRIGGAGMLAQ